ncbi:MAG TPA: lipase family protein [Solirubrobacteraceae bacterium]|nr:lipase family protein [Solirubrobacteraceae bacterium]
MRIARASSAPVDTVTAGRRGFAVGLLAALALLAVWAAVAAAGAGAAQTPEDDPFYRYEGKKSTLEQMAPGTVIKTRTVPFHIAGVELPITAVQLLYRSTSELGRPTVNVTSVLLPPVKLGTPTVLSYQSFYDSLTTEDDPSYAISGGFGVGGEIPQAESVLVTPALLAGETVVVPDTEGEEADFATGPVYGYNTLDSLRAALSSPATGLSSTAKIALAGYSGGAIATEWAAQEAPAYAPEINADLVGASFGGVLVDPAHNLEYVEGSSSWSSIIPMALDGLARAFHLDLTPYLSEYGKELLAEDEHASITNRKEVSGLTWAQLAKPEYASPESIRAYVRTANKLIMGHEGAPTVPLLIGQGNGGEEFEGTPGDKPGIGPGDGVMIAGDVRSLAREYCADGIPVHYTEYQHLGHIEGAAPWLAETVGWLAERFAGLTAPQDCAEIAPGNPLTPIKHSRR